MAKPKTAAENPVGRGLLQAMLNDPDDDSLRLIHADWLDEQGETDRAEFIRVQCGIARLEEADPDRLPLQRREWELLQQNRVQWTPPFSRAIDRVAFRRGLLSHATLSVTRFAAHGRAMFRKAPTIHQLTLEKLSGQGHRLPDSEHLARVTDLDLAEVFPWDWIDGLLDCPHLSRLTRLTLPLLPVHIVTAERAKRLCHWAPLGRLRSLTVFGDPLDSEDLQPLARSSLLATLHALKLGYPPRVIGPSRDEDRGIQALMGSPYPVQLRELHLRGMRIREAGLRALARSAQTRRFSKLGLNFIGLSALV
jgi:uncharacterized protein (TIGR02996 family)